MAATSKHISKLDKSKLDMADEHTVISFCESLYPDIIFSRKDIRTIYIKLFPDDYDVLSYYDESLGDTKVLNNDANRAIIVAAVKKIGSKKKMSNLSIEEEKVASLDHRNQILTKLGNHILHDVASIVEEYVFYKYCQFCECSKTMNGISHRKLIYLKSKCHEMAKCSVCKFSVLHHYYPPDPEERFGKFKQILDEPPGGNNLFCPFAICYCCRTIQYFNEFDSHSLPGWYSENEDAFINEIEGFDCEQCKKCNPLRDEKYTCQHEYFRSGRFTPFDAEPKKRTK